jgi:hypothetical protein
MLENTGAATVQFTLAELAELNSAVTGSTSVVRDFPTQFWSSQVIDAPAKE